MKAKVLVCYYSDRSSLKVVRVYLEPDFEQANKDLNMLKENTHDKNWRLEDCELYNEQHFYFQVDMLKSNVRI